MLVAEIIVLTNAPNRYTYIIPETLAVSVGDFVHITFSKTKRDGLVTRCYESQPSDHGFMLSSIDSVNTKRARVPKPLIQLIDWFAPYYCVTDYVALQCIVGNKKHRDTPALSLSSPAPLPCLSPTQQVVFKAIQTSKKTCHALHGITGSGKTQIYAHLIQACIQRQQSALILIPEISLTPQFTAFFSRHFSRIGVVHSGLTPKNKDIIWNQCLNGELDLVMGPRSAIFMPFESLGLIIIDEEHDNSYKQDSTPRYYTHTVAVERARIQNSTVVFGSATLGVDTHYATQTSDMVYHALTERFNTYPLPDVSILNMTNNQGNWLIHDTLLKGIEENLNAQKRTLILVNRRGYSSFLKCRSCGAIQECTGCQSSFTYHSDGIFRCHKCMTSQKMTRKCSDCGAFDVEYHGIAIQKIESELRRLYPKARLTRIDRDTVKNVSELTDALSTVDTSDILLGTQMISKGHNFKNVALVGMIGVDTLLNFPDYRASERLFQLITQMAGRAGRDIPNSRVFVQTYKPDHYVFKYAKTHDSVGFLAQEMAFRSPLNYPPYCAIANVIFSSKTASLATGFYEKVTIFNQKIKDQWPQIQIIGPKVAPIEKVTGYFRHNVFYKVPLADVVAFKVALKKFPKKRWVRLVIDIDPQSLL